MSIYSLGGRFFGNSEFMNSSNPITQLAHPVKLVTGLNTPNGIAVNNCGEKLEGHHIAIFHIRGQRIRRFESDCDSP